MTTTLQYHPLDLSTIADPYPVYAELRARDPVYWHEQMKSWVLTRYRDCRSVLRNPAVFALDRRRLGEDVPAAQLNVQGQDPPENRPLRALIASTFQAQDLKGICRRGRLGLEHRLKRLAERAELDLMSAIAAPLALQITSELIGIDQPDLATFAAVSEGIARRMDSGLDPTQAGPGDLARDQLNAMVEHWYATTQRPGLICSLRDNPATRRLSHLFVRNTVAAALNASYSTLYAVIGTVVLTLLRRPDILERLRDPNLLSSGVDELVRFEGPAQGTSRVATMRTTIGDTVIERGEVVVTLFAAANRDPEQFPRPDELILDRSPNAHLGFGSGPHVCLGAQLALTWLRELIACLHDLPGTLTLAGEPRYRRTATLRSLEFLPVRFCRQPQSGTRMIHHNPEIEVYHEAQQS